jgi:hypothetical protein
MLPPSPEPTVPLMIWPLLAIDKVSAATVIWPAFLDPDVLLEI